MLASLVNSHWSTKCWGFSVQGILLFKQATRGGFLSPKNLWHVCVCVSVCGKIKYWNRQQSEDKHPQFRLTFSVVLALLLLHSQSHFMDTHTYTHMQWTGRQHSILTWNKWQSKAHLQVVQTTSWWSCFQEADVSVCALVWVHAWLLSYMSKFPDD